MDEKEEQAYLAGQRSEAIALLRHVIGRLDAAGASEEADAARWRLERAETLQAILAICPNAADEYLPDLVGKRLASRSMLFEALSLLRQAWQSFRDVHPGNGPPYEMEGEIADFLKRVRGER
jgi:hypothetical protein